MDKKEQREIYFFDRLSKSICEDEEAQDALKEYRHIGEIFKVLQSYGYLAGMTMDQYLEIALKAGDDLKYFLDPETGAFSEDAVSNTDEAAFKVSFEARRDLILRLIGKTHSQPCFPLIVEVENGMVRGSLERLHNTTQWFGIPYAAPASGANRWRKPQPAPPIERVLNCTKPGEQNLQCFGSKTFGVEGKLTLNICRPNTPEKKLPVMVYFHGGNFQVGKSEEWLGNKFCEAVKAVHVSVEYRLGAMGFNPLPALSNGDPEEDSGNFALLDVIASLRWVQRNIEAFGGDAGNVTISGLSSGGRAVALMMICPLARGLFHRAISFSAGLTITDKEPSQKIFAERFAQLAVEDCRKSSQEDAVAWLLSKDEKDKETARLWLYSLSPERVINLFPLASIRMAPFPHCYRDGTVLPKEGFDTPDMNQVPFIAFCSSDEFSAFAGVDPWFRKRQKAETPDETLDGDKAFCTKYGSMNYGYFNSHQMAERLYPHLGTPIYVGRFHYGHEAKNFSEEFVKRYGAVHGVFLPFLSDQYKMPWKQGNDYFEHVGAEYLGTQLFDYIEQFMECGDPNYSVEEAPWHAWSPEAHHELMFDGDRKRGYVTPKVNRFSFDELFAEFDADPSASEESKSVIAHQVINGRFFSREWDAHYGNAPDPTLIR